MMEQERIDRFWAKVEIKERDDCWLWTAAKNSKGYGSFASAPGKSDSAHKIAWALAKNDGVLSDRKSHIMHTCDVKLCVNPSHLEIGDAAQNNRDALARGVRVPHRLSDREFCRNGHPRTPENTHAEKNTCIICMRESSKRSQAKRREADPEGTNLYHRTYQREHKEEIKQVKKARDLRKKGASWQKESSKLNESLLTEA